jgi:uncharacterized membrane protein
MPRVYLHESVSEHEERTTSILTAYFIGVFLVIMGIFLMYIGVGFGINIALMGAFVFAIFKLLSNYYKQTYYYEKGKNKGKNGLMFWAIVVILIVVALIIINTQFKSSKEEAIAYTNNTAFENLKTSLIYNEDTGELELRWEDIKTRTMNLTIYAGSGDRLVCSVKKEASSGLLSCDVSKEFAGVRAVVYADNNIISYQR